MSVRSSASEAKRRRQGVGLGEVAVTNLYAPGGQIGCLVRITRAGDDPVRGMKSSSRSTICRPSWPVAPVTTIIVSSRFDGSSAGWSARARCASRAVLILSMTKWGNGGQAQRLRASCPGPPSLVMIRSARVEARVLAIGPILPAEPPPSEDEQPPPTRARSNLRSRRSGRLSATSAENAKRTSLTHGCPLPSLNDPSYIDRARRYPGYGDKCARNKRTGPGCDSRRLHQPPSRVIDGAEPGLTEGPISIDGRVKAFSFPSAWASAIGP